MNTSQAKGQTSASEQIDTTPSGSRLSRKIFHEIFLDYLRLHELIPYSVALVSVYDIDRSWARKWSSLIPLHRFKRRCEEALFHVSLARYAAKMSPSDIVVIFEFFLGSALLAYPILLSRRKPSLIFLTWDQQFATRSLLRYGCLLAFRLYLAVARSLAVQAEISDICLPARFRLPANKTVVLPLPSQSRLSPPLRPGQRYSSGHPIKIGVVGMPRRDKLLFDCAFLERVRSAVAVIPNALLIIGCPRELLPPGFSLPAGCQCEFTDTTENSAYYALMSDLHILVTTHDKGWFYYRPSGVLMDAINCGAWVVCPDYPVFRHQVEWPRQVGVTYQSMEMIPVSIKRAAELALRYGCDPHWEWIAGRSIERLAPLITSAVENQLSYPPSPGRK